MTTVATIAAYGAIAAFAIVVLARIVFWAKMPMHVRWELYPVAHEGKRARYGGSYFEDPRWYEGKRHTSLLGEIKAMALEIVFLLALYENNRKMWWRSFPFHFGLYLVICCTGLMVAGAWVSLLWTGMYASWVGSALRVVVMLTGLGGLGLGFIGAIGLLERRLRDPELRDFTSASDLFNLAFFVVVFGLGLLTWFWVDRDFARVDFFVHNLATLKLVELPGAGLEVVLPTLSVIGMAALLVYIPTTHMSHFIGKYFAYHAIRWNDKPNLPGGEQEQVIQGLLTLPVSWQAPHIRGDGKRSWADVATDPTLWKKSK